MYVSLRDVASFATLGLFIGTAMVWTDILQLLH